MGLYWHGVDRDQGCAQHHTVQGTAPTNRDPAPNSNSAEGEKPRPALVNSSQEGTPSRPCSPGGSLRPAPTPSLPPGRLLQCATLASIAQPSGWHLPPSSGCVLQEGPCTLLGCQVHRLSWPLPCHHQGCHQLPPPLSACPLRPPERIGTPPHTPLDSLPAVLGELLFLLGRTPTCLVPPPGPLVSSAAGVPALLPGPRTGKQRGINSEGEVCVCLGAGSRKSNNGGKT